MCPEQRTLTSTSISNVDGLDMWRMSRSFVRTPANDIAAEREAVEATAPSMQNAARAFRALFSVSVGSHQIEVSDAGFTLLTAELRAVTEGRLTVAQIRPDRTAPNARQGLKGRRGWNADPRGFCPKARMLDHVDLRIEPRVRGPPAFSVPERQRCQRTVGVKPEPACVWHFVAPKSHDESSGVTKIPWQNAQLDAGSLSGESR